MFFPAKFYVPNLYEWENFDDVLRVCSFKVVFLFLRVMTAVSTVISGASYVIQMKGFKILRKTVK